MIDYLREAWEHRTDGYWWADNQLLLAVLLGVIGGGTALAFKWAELALAQHYAGGSDA